ncbi:hypothetical protein A3Q56_04299 [Intoshia linei]|uniref:B box-type domain-containing protein n=1 Tax=Intoshia linei TaxID=1819745 RepID=A0A177B141_9BILA|nr:hypothetical protein A3Q56_04299 [Intoshia linei]
MNKLKKTEKLRKWKKLKNINYSLICNYCNNVYREPVNLPCGHTICKCCISNYKYLNKYNDEISQRYERLNINPADTWLDKDIQSNDGDSGLSGVNNRDKYLYPDAIKTFDVKSIDNSYIDNKNCLLFNENSVCPFCFEAIDGSIDLLSVDENLIQIIKQYSVSNANDKSDTESIFKQLIPQFSSKFKNIDQCQICLQHDANQFCTSCKISYCLTCKNQYHPQQGLLKLHNFISCELTYRSFNNTYSNSQESVEVESNLVSNESGIFNSESSFNLCTLHNENVDPNLYCQDCGYFICDSCILNLNHKKHNVQNVDIAYILEKKHIKKLLTHLSEKAKDVSQLNHNVDDRLHEFEEECAKTEKCWSNFGNIIIQSIEGKFKELKSKLNNHFEKIYLKNKYNNEKSSSQIDNVKEKLKNCIYNLKNQSKFEFMLESKTRNCEIIKLISNLDKCFVRYNRGETDEIYNTLYSNLIPCIKEINESINIASCAMDKISNKFENDAIIKITDYSTSKNSINISWKMANIIENIDFKIICNPIYAIKNDTNLKVKNSFITSNYFLKIDQLDFNQVYSIVICTINNDHKSDIIYFFTPPESTFTHTLTKNVNYNSNLRTISFDNNAVVSCNVCFTNGSHNWMYRMNEYKDDKICMGVQEIIEDEILTFTYCMLLECNEIKIMDKQLCVMKKGVNIKKDCTLGIHLNIKRKFIEFYVNTLFICNLLIPQSSFTPIISAKFSTLTLIPGISHLE